MKKFLMVESSFQSCRYVFSNLVLIYASSCIFLTINISKKKKKTKPRKILEIRSLFQQEE